MSGSGLLRRDAKPEAFEEGKPLSGTAKLVFWFLVLLPVVLAFLFVGTFGVNVVFRDQWAVVRLFTELFAGTLSIGDLLAQHNEHRIFFPRIAMLALGTLTGYNTVVEMYFIVACLFATLVILLLAFRSNVRGKLFLFVPIAFLAFSLRQYENMLFGIQIVYVFAQLFSVLAFYLLYKSGRGKVAFPAALASGTVASFSFLAGLFVWPAGLLQLLISPIEKSLKRTLIAVWGLAGAANWIVYFFVLDYVNITPPGRDPSLFYGLTHPLSAIEYFLTLLGSPLFGQESLAVISGLLLAGLVSVGLFLAYKYGKLGENSFWIALLAFAFLTVASTTVGRVGLESGAMWSRYTSFSVLAVIGIYAILVKLAFDKRSYATVAALGVLSALVLLSIPLSYKQGIEDGMRSAEKREEAAFILSTYESQPDQNLETLVGNAGYVKEFASDLEELDYNVFSEPRVLPPLSALSLAPSGAQSDIRTVGDARGSQLNQPVAVPEGEDFVTVTGWAIDEAADDTAGGVYVEVDGELFPAYYGSRVRGPETRFGNPDYEYAGFRADIPMSEVGSGKHEMSLVVLTHDEKRYYRPSNQITLEV